jgi:hypothetical protein
MHPSRRIRLFAAVLAVALVAGACGGGDKDTGAVTTTTSASGNGAAGTDGMTTTTVAIALALDRLQLPISLFAADDIACVRSEVGPDFEATVSPEWTPGADDVAVLLAALAACEVGSAFSRTECVYPAGADSAYGDPIEFDGGYVGTLTDDSESTGVNRGLYGLGQEGGTRTIRGTLAIRDETMGDFDGRFQGRFETSRWEGQGWASGVGDHTGKLLTMGIEAFDSATCPRHPDYGLAIDGTVWNVVIVDS